MSDERGEPYDSAKLFGDSAVKRLDHVHTILGEIKRHGNDSADVQAADLAQSMIETAQEDIHDAQDVVQEYQGDPEEPVEALREKVAAQTPHLDPDDVEVNESEEVSGE